MFHLSAYFLFFVFYFQSQKDKKENQHIDSFFDVRKPENDMRISSSKLSLLHVQITQI